MRNIESVTSSEWEQAFLSQAESQEFDSNLLLEQVLNSNELPDSIEPDQEVRDILGSHEICTVGLEFPESQHGDAIRLAISHFPGGTAVCQLTDSWSDLNRVIIAPGSTADTLTQLARDAIEAEQDGADWNIFEEDEEVTDEGIPAQYFGFRELLIKWPQPT